MADDKMLKRITPTAPEGIDVDRAELARELRRMAIDITGMKQALLMARATPLVLEQADQARERVRTLARMVGVEY